MQPTKNSTQLEKLKAELELFLSAPCYNEELSQADENVKKFVKAMKNFVKVHTEAFITITYGLLRNNICCNHSRRRAIYKIHKKVF